MQRRFPMLFLLMAAILTWGFQLPNQPQVTPGPNEPNWWDVLEKVYHLRMFDDLANPVRSQAEAVHGLFVKAGSGPVVFEPRLAFGMETVTRAGWYFPAEGSAAPVKRPLWSYQFKHPAAVIDQSDGLPPVPLLVGSRIEFDPGDQPFGLWLSNDNFDDGGVFTQPSLVAQVNARLASQPYKVMIYALPDAPSTYLIGWEYSTNDDFQDAVCVIRNVHIR